MKYPPIQGVMEATADLQLVPTSQAMVIISFRYSYITFAQLCLLIA